MGKLAKLAAMGIAASVFAMPAQAQVEAERGEARTTYELRMIDIGPGNGERWQEIVDDHLMPAAAAAGLPAAQIHWPVNGPWDRILVFEMRDGMAELDWHTPPDDAAFFNALIAQEGSMEAAQALMQELNSLVVDVDSIYTHTHP